MTIEFLFPEVCNLFGDVQNVEYLHQCAPSATVIRTALTETPYFVSETPDVLYMGSMSEHTQRRVIEKLLPLKERLGELIDNGTVILLTGNAGEVLMKHISYVTEEIETDALGLLDLTVKTDWFARYNGKVLGTFENMKMVGFRSQFSMVYGDNTRSYFIKTERGIGINKESSLEGVRKNNLFVTALLGPILPNNPPFTEYLLSLAGNPAPAAFRPQAMAAYEQRLKEFGDSSTEF